MAFALSPGRKRIAVLVASIGFGLVVERGIASGGDDDAAPARDSPAQTVRGASAPAGEAAGPATALQLGRLAVRRRAAASDAAASAAGETPFEPISWQPAAASEPAPPPPPPPEAPLFPYACIGGLTEDGVRTAFFQRGDRVLSVRPGDTIDGTWHVDQLDEQLMTLTYLPLQQSQDVSLGSGR